MVMMILGYIALAACLGLFGWALLALFLGLANDFVEKYFKGGQ